MGKFETRVAEKKDCSASPKDYPFYPFEFTPLYSGINTLYEGKETEGVFKKYIDLQELNREQAYLLSNLTDWITREVCADKAVQTMFA